MNAPSITYTPRAFASVDMDDLLREVAPAQHTITMWGKTHDRPRLEAWFGARPYTYSGETMAPREWTPGILAIKDAVERHTGHRFGSCLANHYRDGSDHVSWHSDDERGVGPVIASVSFGGGRRFVMRPKDGGSERPEWLLGYGALFVMDDCQGAWEHRIAKTARAVGDRLSLTFRQSI